MPIGYDYHCDACEYDWMLFSTRLALGPTQWEHVRYTCFKCQTFLTVANSVDRSSWAIWVRNNRQSLDKNPTLAQLVNLVDQQLSSVHGFTPSNSNSVQSCVPNVRTTKCVTLLSVIIRCDARAVTNTRDTLSTIMAFRSTPKQSRTNRSTNNHRMQGASVASFFEINVNSRRPVMRCVRRVEKPT